ncbi:MAG: amidohydrolase family protein [Gemmatimonadetes bacterium]|nr:amidohydrolase family protein [Gemmatimonadota bacterium]
MMVLSRRSHGTDPSAKGAAGARWMRRMMPRAAGPWRMRTMLLLLILGLAPDPVVRDAAASKQKPAGPQVQPIALTGGTVHTVSGAIIEGATILFEAGVITGIGTDLDLPENTMVVDVTGKHVYPGLLAAPTNLGLTEIGSVRATQDNVEIGDITPSVRAVSAVNPDSEYFPVARANGILTALTMPSGGLIAGLSGLIALDGWTTEEMTLETTAGLHVQWPSYRIFDFEGSSSREEQVEARREALTKLRDAFREARAYMIAKEAEEAGGAPFHPSDLGWDAMIPVLRKELPVFVHAAEEKQIHAAIDWALAEDVRIILVGGTDAWRVADRVKEHDIPVIIGAVHYLPARRWEPYDTPFTNALKLHEAGLTFCIGQGGGASNVRNLPYHAATAAAYGLPKEEALKSVTLYPARILGVEDRLGSLETGKDATLIVTDGDPLEIMTRVDQAFIRGRPVDLSSKHTDLYDKYRARLEQLK